MPDMAKRTASTATRQLAHRVLWDGLTCRSRPWVAEEVSRWRIVVLCSAHDQFRRWTPVWDAARTIVDLTGALQEREHVVQW